MIQILEHEAFLSLLADQPVSTPRHRAVKCCICGTVQSQALFQALSKLTPEQIQMQLGFSCIGRQTNAGPWSEQRRNDPAEQQKGCDWTLGGLLQLHELEVVMRPNGTHVPVFVPASGAEALALERRVTEMTKAVPA